MSSLPSLIEWCFDHSVIGLGSVLKIIAGEVMIVGEDFPQWSGTA